MPDKHLSYAQGAASEALLYQTIGETLDGAQKQFGSRSALIVKHQNIHLTYAQLAEQTNKFAAGLLSLGLKPGDRIGIWAPNCYEWIVTQFAEIHI